MDKEKKSIGAFWKNVSANMNEYYSGNIEIGGQKYPLVMFINKNKKDKQPDLHIYLSEPKTSLASEQIKKESGIPF